MAKRFSGAILNSNRVSYRNAYAKNAAEEVRALVAKYVEERNIIVKSELEAACQEFVEQHGTERFIPKKTGNLLDSFGVSLYKGDALFNIYAPPQQAQKYQRSGLPGTAPVAQIITRFGNIRDIISGRRELVAMSAQAHIGPAKLTKAGLMTRNTLTAIMFIAAPYARAVHEKGFGFNRGPINEYYELLEARFENDLLQRLQDMYPDATRRTPYRKLNNMPPLKFV